MQLNRRFGLVVLSALFGAAAAAYAGALALLYVFQERVIFPGKPLPPEHAWQFEQAFTEVKIPVGDAELNALHFPQPNPRGLVFFLHGNAGNLQTWTTGVDFYRRINYDLFIFDYRGYGKSTGTIQSEAQLHADVRAAWNAIAPQYRGKPIVIFGRSLGTALAVELAREVDPALLVLVTPYTSVAAVGKRAYPWAPGWLLKYPLRTDAVIGQVISPVLMLHGTQDNVIPLAESEKLQTLVRSPKELVVVQNAGHNDIHTFPIYLDTLADRLTALADGKVRSRP